jgi:plasmid stabilization system protein ParE
VTVRILKIAQQELAAQLAWLATVNPTAARQLLDDVQAALTLMDSGVVDGAEVVLKSGRRVRRWLVLPLVIFYVRRGATVSVIRIRHGSQRPITQ